MYYSKILSHPNVLLEKHLNDVSNYMYNKCDKSNLKTACKIIGYCHDFAKSTSFFQEYIRDTNNYTGSQDDKKHSLLSATFTYYALKKTYSDEFDFDLPIIGYIIVLSHHGNLKDIPDLWYYQNIQITEYTYITNQINDLKNNLYLQEYYNSKNIDMEYFLDNFDEINNDLIRNLRRFRRNLSLKEFFLVKYLWSILLDADKMDASKTDNIPRKNISPTIIDDYKINNNFNTTTSMNKIREESYKEVINNITNVDLDNHIFTINLPTGTGKTLTGTSAALKLRERIINEKNNTPRILYILPFLSIIDQNAEVLEKVFSEANLKGNDYLLKHNYLSLMDYEVDDEKYNINNSEILIEGWNSEFIISTFHQFFYSIMGNQNKYNRKFSNIKGSIIILDEIQSLPHKYWMPLNKVLNYLCNEYDCYIILMTATQPLLFDESEVISLVNNSVYYFNQFDRVDYNFYLNPYFINDFTEHLINQVNNSDKTIMVVLNTIEASKIVYNSIKYDCPEDCELIYLSTYLTPYERLQRINKIKKSDNRKIIVTTQLIEAGVDITVDVIYRDLAPLDSIIQTAGRCNREYNTNKGEVNIIQLTDSNDKKYSNYIYDPFLLTSTRSILENYNTTVSEKEFNLIAINKYYNIVKSKDKENLISKINNLQYELVNKKFRLINKNYETISVYVGLNKEAVETFEEYKYIKKHFKGFDRHLEFQKIKNKFYNYTIQIPVNKMGKVNLFGELGVILTDYDFQLKYDYETGFIVAKDEMSWII